MSTILSVALSVLTPSERLRELRQGLPTEIVGQSGQRQFGRDILDRLVDSGHFTPDEAAGFRLPRHAEWGHAIAPELAQAATDEDARVARIVRADWNSRQSLLASGGTSDAWKAVERAVLSADLVAQAAVFRAVNNS